MVLFTSAKVVADACFLSVCMSVRACVCVYICVFMCERAHFTVRLYM